MQALNDCLHKTWRTGGTLGNTSSPLTLVSSAAWWRNVEVRSSEPVVACSSNGFVCNHIIMHQYPNHSLRFGALIPVLCHKPRSFTVNHTWSLKQLFYERNCRVCIHHAPSTSCLPLAGVMLFSCNSCLSLAGGMLFSSHTFPSRPQSLFIKNLKKKKLLICVRFR